MEYVYASLLLHTAGKEISEESIRRVLDAAGVKVDEVRVKMLVAALKEINIDEVLKQAVTPVVAATPVAAPTPATPAQQPAPAKEEAKEKEEEEKEVSEEEIAEGISSLFG